MNDYLHLHETFLVDRTTVCCFCYQKWSYNGHALRLCPEFRKYKREIKLSPQNYTAENLTPSDEAGFCAAGVIPCYKENDDYFMLCMVETRYGIQAVNFAAGRRECVYDGNRIRAELSIETALNEFEEEMGDIITDESLQTMVSDVRSMQPVSVFFAPNSKMAIYFYLVDATYKTSIVKKIGACRPYDPCALSPEVDDFVWIKMEFDDKGKLISDHALHDFANIVMDGIGASWSSLHHLLDSRIKSEC